MGCGKVLAIAGLCCEQRAPISEFTAYSLLFPLFFSWDKKSRFSVIPDTAGSCAELSVARNPLDKKFAAKFPVKFAVLQTPGN